MNLGTRPTDLRGAQLVSFGMPQPLSADLTSGAARHLLLVPGRPATLAPSGYAQRSRPAKISATVLTKNSSARLEAVLQALRWCDEVIVLDTGSTDATTALAQGYPNVAVHHLTGAFQGFGRARLQAVAAARNNWILSIDSDEVVSPELAAEIGAAALDSGTVYSVPFHNYFGGRLITTCGWYPDRHERLFNRAVTNFCASEVHERVQTAGLKSEKLRGPVQHYSYGSLDDFLRKMHSYSRLFAQQNAGRKPSGPGKAVARSLWAFFKSYGLQCGCLQGRDGLVISAYKAQTVFWKYLFLDEANDTLRE
jgi:glycosyltransferase involved in cell wall biosynthesis